MDEIAKHIVKKTEREAGRAVQRIREKITNLIDTNPKGQYTHNIISSMLRSLADKHGYVVTNRLVRELQLPMLYGINPISIKEGRKSVKRKHEWTRDNPPKEGE